LTFCTKLTSVTLVTRGTRGTGGHLPSGLDGDAISVGSDVRLERAAGSGGESVSGDESGDVIGEAGAGGGSGLDGVVVGEVGEGVEVHGGTKVADVGLKSVQGRLDVGDLGGDRDSAHRHAAREVNCVATVRHIAAVGTVLELERRVRRGRGHESESRDELHSMPIAVWERRR
jgi:hypothetical protein